MGKASSSKKVARAARVGNTSKGPERRQLGFPLAIAVTVLLGTTLVLVARSNGSSAVEPKLKTHWHAAYGIWNCDHWEAPVADSGTDPHGIHTHDADATATGGIMHIHPFDSSAAGVNATFAVFFNTTGVKWSNSKIEFPAGVTLANGTKCGDKDAVLEVVRWDANNGSTPPEVITKDFGKIRYRKDREAFTIALVPKDTAVGDIAKPTSIPQLDQLSDLGASGATGTGASGTGDSGTGASGTGASGTGASGTGASGTGASGTSSTTVAAPTTSSAP